MKFALEVGDTEKHLLEYDGDGFSGSYVIRVDEREVRKASRFFFKPLHETHDLDIGKDERLDVKIETLRNTLLGEKTCVYVNGRLMKRYEE
jgi:hypothetical protein